MLPVSGLVLSILGAILLPWLPVVAIPVSVVALVLSVVCLKGVSGGRPLVMATLVIAVMTIVAAAVLGSLLLSVGSGGEASAPALRP